MSSRNLDRVFMRFPEFKRKAVTLSYDDGVPQDKRLIEIMNKNGLRGTFNINSELFEEVGPSCERFRMSKAETIELYTATDNEIAVHGARHLALADVKEGVALNDVVSDKKNLERILGKVINGMAYAYGSYNDEVVELLKKCGILYARTVNNSMSFRIPTDWLRLCPTCHHNNPKLMEMAKEFVENETNDESQSPMLFYLWGHSFEFDRNNNWNVIEKFAEYIGNRNDIWYATNGQIYNYVQAFDSLRFSLEGNICFNPSYLDVYLCYNEKNIKIGPGETIKL